MTFERQLSEQLLYVLPMNLPPLSMRKQNEKSKNKEWMKLCNEIHKALVEMHDEKLLSGLFFFSEYILSLNLSPLCIEKNKKEISKYTGNEWNDATSYTRPPLVEMLLLLIDNPGPVFLLQVRVSLSPTMDSSCKMLLVLDKTPFLYFSLFYSASSSCMSSNQSSNTYTDNPPNPQLPPSLPLRQGNKVRQVRCER